VLASSNSGSLVNFSAGTKFVFCDYPAGRAVYLDTATNVTIPGLTLSGGTANGVLYLNGSKVATSGSALVFDGNNLGVGAASGGGRLEVKSSVGSIPGNGNATAKIISGAAAAVDAGPSLVFSGQTGNTTAEYAFAGLQGVKQSASANDYSGALIFLTQNNGGSTLLDERMRLTSVGNLGIGTSNPGSRLEIYGGAAGTAAYATIGNATTAGLFGVGTGNDVQVRTAQAVPITFYTSGLERMRLDSSGNLGIGTTTIGSRLTIGDPGTGQSFSNAGGGNFNIGLLAGTGSALAYVFQRANSSLLFGTNNTEVARFDSSGNLGIGTSSPAYRVDAQRNSYGVTAAFRAYDGTNNPRLIIYGSSQGTTLQQTFSTGSPNLMFAIGGAEGSGTEIARFDGNGNLGITQGNAPTQALSLYRGGSTNAIMSAGNSNTGLDGTWFGVDTAGNGIINQTQALPLIFSTSGTERARITSTGLVGIGTSAPTSNGGSAAGLVHIHGAASNAWAINHYTNGTTGANAADGLIVGNIGADAYIYNYENSPIIFATNSAERMRLDTNGDLALGATSVARVGSDRTLYIEGSSFASLNLACGGAYAGAGLTINSSAALEIRNTGAERARIDTNGRMVINGTVAAYSSTLTLYRAGNSYNLTSTVTGTGNEGHVVFENGNGAVGTIFTNGTATAYNTSSDYRLKNTIAPMTGALAKVALLKPCTYKWNADGSDGQGFIAHELAEVVPQCVTGEKDAVDAEGKPRYQGVDTSFLVATLTAAIQELTARVAQLETK
jgi:hypothetical protein